MKANNISLYPTYCLSLLAKKKLLRSRLEYLNCYSPQLIDFLTGLLRKNRIKKNSNIPKLALQQLKNHGLIIDRKNKNEHLIMGNNPAHQASLFFVKALNFELTYDCNMNCPHCLQSSVKEEDEEDQEPLSTEKLKETITQGWFSGLTDVGINFTGGELLLSREDVFELIEHCSKLGISSRLNTNSWWGNKKIFRIGKKSFSSANHFVAYMKELGLTIFAFSYDVRYQKKRLIALEKSIEACEQHCFPYQIIFTGVKNEEILKVLQKISKNLGSQLNYSIPMSMEMVDIGSAKNLQSDLFAFQDNECQCDYKGFNRPSFVHIDPYGGVRSCLYAQGMKSMGNLQQSNLYNIINEFPANQLANLLQDKKQFDNIKQKLFLPYQDLYWSFKHPCTSNIVLAKIVEKSGYSSINDSIDSKKLRQIHNEIIRELTE